MFALVRLSAPRDRSDSLGFDWALLVLFGFTSISVGSLYGSPGSCGLVGVYSNVLRGHRVHSASLGFMLGIAWFSRGYVGELGPADGFWCEFSQARVQAVGFIPVRVGSLGLDSGRRVHSGSLGFTRVRPGVVGIITVRVGSLGCA